MSEISEPTSKIFQLRASAAFFRQIDEFRRSEPDLPPRAEAMRRLVSRALAARNPGLHRQVVNEFSRLGETVDPPWRGKGGE
jgi:hypothetical protein